jgi:RNase P subunit RPR2
VLTLVCPHCGNSFAAAIQDRRTFEAMRVESMIERCPSCEHASRFKKAEYRYIADERPNSPLG